MPSTTLENALVIPAGLHRRVLVRLHGRRTTSGGWEIRASLSDPWRCNRAELGTLTIPQSATDACDGGFAVASAAARQWVEAGCREMRAQHEIVADRLYGNMYVMNFWVLKRR